MTADPQPPDLFHLVGVVVASSQAFEVIFVIAAKLALKQADIAVLEDIEPLSTSKSFKQPVKALLNELAHAGTVDASLEAEITRLIEDRHRIIHRSFLEGGWPAPLTEDAQREFVRLCTRVSADSVRLASVFADLVLQWMKKFPATSQVAIEYEEKFKKLAGRFGAPV